MVSRSLSKRLGRTRNVNLLAISTALLAVIFGNILYKICGRETILYPAIFEALIFMAVPILNLVKKPGAAKEILFINNIAAVLYFGLVLDQWSMVETMAIFLAGVLYLLFTSFKRRLIYGLIIFLVVVCIELNYELLFIKPVEFYPGFGKVLRRMVLGTVFGLSAIMLYFYVEERFHNHKRLVSHRKETRKLNTELAASNAALSTSNAALASSKIKLEELNAALERKRRAMEEFVKETTHEIRNPHNQISAIVQAYSANLNVNENATGVFVFKQHFRALEVGCKNVDEILGNVLSWAAIEADKHEQPIKSAFDLCTFLNESAIFYRAGAEIEGISLLEIYSNGLPQYIVEDRTFLKKILGNLLSNAIKYSPANSTIYLKAYNDENLLKLSIQNQAYIREEDKEKIFEPFVHGVAGSHDADKGTGLGLGIVRKLIEKLGGDLELTSEVDTGTTFTISLPYVMASTVEIVRSLVELDPNPLNGISILVIEDDDIQMAMYRHMLNGMAGGLIFEARTWEEAVNTLKSHLPDVILMDCHIKGITGVEMLSYFKDSPQLENIPIVAVSGNAFTEYADMILREGASYFQRKPVNFKDLIFTIYLSCKNRPTLRVK